MRLRRAPFAALLVMFGAVASVASATGTPAEPRAAAQEREPDGSPRVKPEVPATSVNLSEPRSQNSPALAADPTDARFLVLANRLDAPDYSCDLQLSPDEGQSWVPSRPVPKLPEGAEKCYAPEVAFDPSGVISYLFVGLRGLGNVPMGVFLTTSRDRGRSFSEPRQVLGPNHFQVRMVIDQDLGPRGRLHLAWLQANSDPPVGGFPTPPNPIMSSFSDDGGQTFSEPAQVSDPDRARVVAPTMVVGADHALHVLYYDLERDAVDYQGLEGPVWPGTWSLVLSSSFDRGRQFGPGVLVDGDVVPPERVMLIFTMPPPTITADPSGGLYAAWYDARNGDWDVFLRRSADQGRSWQPPLRLNDDAGGAGRHQYLPQLSSAPGGRLDAIFYDRRNDPGNVSNDVYYTWSGDGGRSFATNRRMNRESFDSRIGQRYLVPAAAGLVEIGSRLALLSRDSEAVAAWTDTRNAFGRAGPDGGPNSQDVYVAEAEFSPATARAAEPGDSGIPTAALLGLAVAAGVLMIIVVAVRRRRRTELTSLT